VNEQDACLTAELLVLTDTWGVFTHGTKNLRGYLRRLQAGGIRADAVPQIVSDGPSWAIVDAGSGLGMVGSRFAMRAAIDKARTAGIGFAGVRNSCHFGAAGCYAAMAAAENMIGIAMANDIPSVTAPGSRAAVLGSNPLAFALPTGDARPILLDMATSAVAGGKVFAAATLGKPIPNNWIVDADGLPTTDPRVFPHAGALVPMAGHKGYGIALLVETLSAILTGASIAGHVLSWSFDDPTRATGHGAAFFAIDLNAMMPGSLFHQRLRQTMEEIRAAPKARGAERIYLPGEMEWDHRERALREGIELPEDVLVNLREVARETRLELPAAHG
jgi:LDH2 family malate/lactate/ureidoglycolate dehydrogenase